MIYEFGFSKEGKKYRNKSVIPPSDLKERNIVHSSIVSLGRVSPHSLSVKEIYMSISIHIWPKGYVAYPRNMAFSAYTGCFGSISFCWEALF